MVYFQYFQLASLRSIKQCLCVVISLKEGEDQKEISIEPAQALDEVEPLPEDCYTRPISLPEGNTLSRNYANYPFFLTAVEGNVYFVVSSQ